MKRTICVLLHICPYKYEMEYMCKILSIYDTFCQKIEKKGLTVLCCCASFFIK